MTVNKKIKETNKIFLNSVDLVHREITLTYDVWYLEKTNFDLDLEVRGEAEGRVSGGRAEVFVALLMQA